MNSLIRKLSSEIANFEKNHDKKTVALIYVCISTITFTIVLLYGKISLGSADVMQVQILRGVSLAALYALISNANGSNLAVMDRRLRWLNFWRGFLGSIMNVFMFFLLLKLPASLLGVIQMTSSLIISLFDYLLYNTKYTKWEIFYSILTMLGVTFIIDPSFILFWIDSTALNRKDSNQNYAEGYEKIFWIVLYMISVALWSFSMVIVRKLKDVPVTSMNFTFGYILAIMASLCQLYWQNAVSMDPTTLIGVIIFVGVFSMIDQISFIRSFQIGKQGTLNVLKNTYIIFVILFEIIYLKEYPTVYSLMGSALIIFSSVKLTLSKASK